MFTEYLKQTTICMYIIIILYDTFIKYFRLEFKMFGLQQEIQQFMIICCSIEINYLYIIYRSRLG